MQMRVVLKSNKEKKGKAKARPKSESKRRAVY